MAQQQLEPDQLAKLSLFKDASFEYLQDLLKRCEQQHCVSGSEVLTPNQNNNRIFCVLSGRLAVHLNSTDGEPITTLGPGHCVGEMSIIEDTTPSAYVIAQEDSELLVIDRETLWTMVQRSHAIAHNLLSVLSSRVRKDNEMIADGRNLLRDFERHQLTDGLTGLHNRAWMDDMFDRTIARHHGDGKPISLMLIDIDQLKAFNQEYGHLAGDHVIYAVADTLREHFRSTDLIARSGGDEFAVLLPETDLTTALKIAERTRESVEQYNELANEDVLAITVSVGVAELGADNQLLNLLDRAADALDDAKRQGNQCVKAA